MNLELLQQIKDYIMEEPRRLNMTQWGAFFDPESNDAVHRVMSYEMFNNSAPKISKNDLPPCGTVGCIAGAAYVLSAPDELETERRRGRFYFVAFPINIAERARIVMDLTPKQARRLFLIPSLHGSNYGWPPAFADRYLKAKTPLKRAQVTCERIDHFIATEGKE